MLLKREKRITTGTTLMGQQRNSMVGCEELFDRFSMASKAIVVLHAAIGNGRVDVDTNE